MTKIKTLTKAISYAITGGVMAFGAISNAHASSTMYNAYNASDDAPRISDGPTDGSQGSQSGGTDGWVWGGVSVNPTGIPADPGWVGAVDATTGTPFGYSASMALNWAAHITAANDSLEISQDDSWNSHSLYADIDTAGGAWHQAVGNGWRHNIDIGLFKSDVTQKVTLNINGILNPNDNFGITVYDNMSTAIIDGGYNHHGPYFGDSTSAYEDLNYFKHTPRDPVTGLTTNTLEFTANAGQIYTIILGGNNGAHWSAKYDSYRLNIATSPVPVPGAAWLFGSALLGMINLLRKHRK